MVVRERKGGKFVRVSEAMAKSASVRQPVIRTVQDGTSLNLRPIVTKDRKEIQLDTQITPARPAKGGHPVPYYMALGQRLRVDLAAGNILRRVDPTLCHS